jgi:hypothetical protein
MMREVRQIKGAIHCRFRLPAGILVVLFLVLAGISASPTLHHAIHADAGSTNHHCIITVLAQGQFEAPLGGAILCFAPSSFHYAAPSLKPVFGAETELLPPGRAPPSVFV